MKRSPVPAILASAAAAILATVAVLLGLEAYLLATGRAPITWYSECAISAFPLWAIFVTSIFSAGIGALLAHFFWSRANSVPPRPV